MFDGVKVIPRADVLIEGTRIVSIADHIEAPEGSTVIAAEGKTLMPGLIDAHVHAKPPALAQAILYGVTTELDLGSHPDWMINERRRAAADYSRADVRSSSFGATVLGGHPSFFIGTYFSEQFPVVSSAEEVPGFIADRVAEGADYIKLLIDDGTTMGHPSPSLTRELASVIVDEAHHSGLLAVAHATSLQGFEDAVAAGVDGIVHMFFDTAPTPEIVQLVRDAGIFLVTTLSTAAAMSGEEAGRTLAADERASRYLSDAQRENLRECWHFDGPADLGFALAATVAFHRAGVPILAGTDAAITGVVGVGHGVSMHGELQLLVQAGLTPVEALRAATSEPALRFGLNDRGTIEVGKQADLLLVDGDPTLTITDTLSIEAVWRCGQRLDRDDAYAGLANHAPTTDTVT